MDRIPERRTGDHAVSSAPTSPAPRPTSADNAGSAPPAPAALTVRARILLADDNADQRDYLLQLLSERYTIEVVANGAEALAAAQAQPPDLVLADVMLPELDGFGLLHALRSDLATRAIPVILLSARASEEATIEGPEAGADDYLVKPFSAREVLARVASHLEMARLRREAVARTRELEATIEAITDAVFIYDAQGNIVRTNSTARTLFGPDVDADYERRSPRERARLVEAAYEDGRLIPIEESGLYRLFRGEVLTGANSLDVRLRSHSGRQLQFTISGAPLRNEAGAVVGGVAVSRDVTARRALERESRWQASMLERAHDAIFMWELGGPIVYWNRGAELLYGYRREDAVGRISHDLLQTLLPTTREVFDAALEREGEWTGELTHTTRDGRSIVVLSRHQLLREPDGRRYVLETSRDVTERKRLERRTRDALDALLELAAAMVSDPTEGSEAPNGLATGSEQRADETVHRFATLCSRVLACERIAIITVEPGTELLRAVAVTGSTPEQEQRFRAGFSNLRLADRFGAEVAARLMSGETALVDVEDLHENDPAHVLSRSRFLIAPMLAGNAFYGYVGVNFGDEESHYSAESRALALGVAQLIGMVMERARLRHEREEARAREVALAEANRRMDEFLGIASHELRTPLTVVTANVQMAKRHLRALVRGKRAEPSDHPSRPEPDVERTALLLERADRQILRLDRLVGDLLDASRIQAGKLELRREPCDLLAVVREAVETQRAAWSDRSITLDLPRTDAILLNADPDRIGQVVNNYLTNALKYSPPEHPVALRVRRAGQTARVEVSDHGPGLSAEQQIHLFERFFRVPGIEQQSGSGVGLGLGLYICKTIAERHGGVAGVESAVGKGSTFWFTLPLDRDDPPPGAEQHLA